MARQLSPRARLALGACGVATAGVAVWWLATALAPAHDAQVAARNNTPAAGPGEARAGVSLAAALPVPTRTHDLPVLRARLAAGPLAHSTPDGALPCAWQGLAPSVEVRRRFDWYAQALASAATADRLDIDEIEVLLVQDAEASCGAGAAQEVRTLWRGYTAIAVRGESRSADLRTRAERLKAAQQTQLGPQWAEAFFGEDHRALEARLAGAGTAPGRSEEAQSSAQPEARAALAELQSRWADFDRRLAEAGREWQALAAQGGATPAQADALLNRWFSADERLRASALLNLPV